MNVEELLKKESVPYIPKGADFIVSCLNPEHADRNPSMRIDQITGVFNCFSCGFKGNLFSHFGEAASFLEQKRNALKRKIDEKRADTVGLTIPTTAIPYKGSWRDIKSSTYEHFEAFESHEKDFVGRIVFPIRDISGRIRAFQGRHTTGGVPKYLITPRKVKLPLYPTVKPIQGSVILVEGIFDAINLYDKGLPNATCSFGASNVSEEKLQLLKMQGVDTVVIFFDGDEAGDEGVRKVEEKCEKVELAVRKIRMANTDPGALNVSQVLKIKHKLYGD